MHQIAAETYGSTPDVRRKARITRRTYSGTNGSNALKDTRFKEEQTLRNTGHREWRVYGSHGQRFVLLRVSAKFKCYNFGSQTLERTDKQMKDSQIAKASGAGMGGNTPESNVHGLHVSTKLNAS